MKVKGKELILKIVSLCATVLSFVGLAFKFAVERVSAAGHSETMSLSRTDWWDSVNDFLKELTSAGHAFWQIARVFMIISFVVLAVLAVLTIIEFFFQHKYLSLAKRIVSIVSIVCIAVFFLTLVIGGILVANKLSSEYASYLFIPHVGPWFMLVFGLGASITALLDRRRA